MKTTPKVLATQLMKMKLAQLELGAKLFSDKTPWKLALERQAQHPHVIKPRRVLIFLIMMMMMLVVMMQMMMMMMSALRFFESSSDLCWNVQNKEKAALDLT